MSKKRKQRSLKSKILDSVEVIVLTLIVAIGVTIAFVNTSYGHSLIVQDNAQRVSANLTPSKAEENRHIKTSYDARKTKSITAKELFRTSKLPASPIGRMSIPSVDTHNPLFEGFGSQQQNLSYGVCTVLPNRKMGDANNYVLAGHYMGNYGPSVLDNMHKMKLYEKIYVTDMQKIYAYEAEAKSYSIKPTQVEVENNHGKLKMITLITCSDFNVAKYGYGGHRTIVQGKLVDTYPATQENLSKYELSNQVINKKVSSKSTKGIKKATENITLNQLKVWGGLGILLIIVFNLIRIWIIG